MAYSLDFRLQVLAILVSAGRRVAQVWRPAALGAVIGILVNGCTRLLVFS